MKGLKILLILIVLGGFSLGQIPQLINYQGYLTDGDGGPLSGEYTIEFMIYDNIEDGTLLWSENQEMIFYEGRFNIILGATTPFPTTLFEDDNRFLAIKVGNDPEMTPRKQITSVAYALKSQNTDSLNSFSSDDFVKQGEENSVTIAMIDETILSSIDGVTSNGGDVDLVAGDNISILSNNEDKRITISASGGDSGDDLGNHTARQNLQMNNKWISNDGNDEGIYVSEDGEIGINTQTFGDQYWGAQLQSTTSDYEAALAGFALNTGHNGVGGYFKSQGPSGYGILSETSGNNGIGVYGKSSGASGEAVKGWAEGESGRGFTGVSSGEKGIGVYGWASYSENSDENNYGGYFESYGYRGRGVYGRATGYYGYGVLAQSTGSYGRGLSASASGESGYGVYAIGTGDYGRGIYGLATAEKGVGVYGWASYSSPSSSNNYGGYFTSSGERGRGVYGKATGTYGYGVFGEGMGDHSIGVFGKATGDNAWAIYGYGHHHLAGYFYGDVDIDGTLSKTAGSFKIDHPLDPKNKYLQHSFVESPDMMNVYNGNVVLDGNGEAVVVLPDYFEALNIDFRYQLTCIGGFAPVYIARKITDNKFKIAGGEAGMEISWQVTGIRNDAYARNHRIEVEVPKEGKEQGKYLFPEEHNQPESMGIRYKQHLKILQEQNSARSETHQGLDPVNNK